MVKAALIGVGEWGKNHARVFTELLNEGVIENLAVCDVDVQRARKFERKGVDILKDYGDVLNDSSVNAVSICTPTSTHTKLVKEALNARKHVFVEKPIAPDARSTRALTRLAEKKKKVLMVGHIFVHNPITKYIKKCIDDGTLGKVYYTFGSFSGFKDLREDCGTTVNYAVHHISVANYLFGKPTFVSGVCEKFLRNEYEDVTLAILRYGKTLVYFDASWLPPGKKRDLTIVGSKATIVADLLAQKIEIHHNRFEGGKAVAGNIERPYVENAQLRWEEPLKVELRHFIECIKTGERPLTDGQSAVAVMEVIDKLIGNTCLSNGDG